MEGLQERKKKARPPLIKKQWGIRIKFCTHACNYHKNCLSNFFLLSFQDQNESFD